MATKRNEELDRNLKYERELRGRIDSFYGGAAQRLKKVGLSCTDCPLERCKVKCKGIWFVGGLLPYEKEKNVA